MAKTLPVLVLTLLTLTLVGGALADAVDRRRLLIWTQLGMAAVAADHDRAQDAVDFK